MPRPRQPNREPTQTFPSASISQVTTLLMA